MERRDRCLGRISEIKIQMNEVIKNKSQEESTTDNHEKNSKRKKTTAPWFPGLLPFKHSLRIFQ